MKTSFVDDLVYKFKSGFPVTAVNTTETDRCIQEIKTAGWLMGEGCKVTLTPADRNLFKTLFNTYTEYSCPLTPSGELTADIKKLVALMRRLCHEKSEAAADVDRLLDTVGYPVITWSHTGGFDNGAGDVELDQALVMAAQPYDSKARDKNPLPRFCILVYKNANEFLDPPGPECARFRSALHTIFCGNRLVDGSIRRLVIMLQPDWTPHTQIAHCVNFVEFEPPNEEQLSHEVTYVEESLQSSKRDVVKTCPTELRKPIITALRGFTQHEAVNALAYCIVKHRGFCPDMVPTLHGLKAETLKRDEVLEYIDAEYLATTDQIGGYENYLEFISECQECYTDEAAKAGLKKPKGVLLLGLPGCVAEDTMVSYRRGKRTGNRSLPINVFCDKVNGTEHHHAGVKWKPGLDTYLQSFNPETGRIFYNLVKGVYKKGRKHCIRIITDNAGSVTLTDDHPIMTAEIIFKAAGELRVGDKLLVRGNMHPTKLANKTAPKHKRRVTVETLKYHPRGWPHPVKEPTTGKVYTYLRQHRARLVLEAHMNGLAYEEFIRILQKEPTTASALKYLEDGLEVHHQNEDPTDDRLENLLVLTKPAHTKLHCDESRFNVAYTTEATITGIEAVGYRETYDVSMEDPYANFVVNDGIIAHNTGKSMVGMATARIMSLPLVKYDFGSVFGGIVGQSESTQRRVLKRVTALGPCVLLIDEADKAFAGMDQTIGDSGTGQRVFGRLLTWMATENTDAFIVMTMNRLKGVPVEMLRAGRLDATFYTEFPSPPERQEILAIHMRKNGVDPNCFDRNDWKTLVNITEDFAGAELEQLVIKAVRTAWKATKLVQPKIAHLEAARVSVNPVAHLDREGMQKILEFCQDKATPVSKKKRIAKSQVGRLRSSILVDNPENN
jgi:ATP-dependent 26S proteasome regulatory subunit